MPLVLLPMVLRILKILSATMAAMWQIGLAALASMVVDLLAAVLVQTILIMPRRFLKDWVVRCMHPGKLRAGIGHPARHTARYSRTLCE